MCLEFYFNVAIETSKQLSSAAILAVLSRTEETRMQEASVGASMGDLTDMMEREMVLAQVKDDGMALAHAGEKWSGDPEIVRTAVMSNGAALSEAAENCRNDPEIVLTAVQSNWQALRYAAEPCRSDPEIVLTAVQSNWQAL
eukprot:2466388-Amphidinium_carterae.1